MEKSRSPVWRPLLRHCLQAVLLVVLMGAVLFLGRGFLNRAVLALCFLLPVGWSAARWGPAPGTCAALAAILVANLLLPLAGSPWGPGLLVAWAVLALLLLGANGVYYWMQTNQERNPAGIYREYCAPLAEELQAELAQLRSTEGILAALADHFQASFGARWVEVRFRPVNACPRMTTAQPEGATTEAPAGEPDRVLPIPAVVGLAGEICLWRGESWLPPQDSYLFQFLMDQAAQALERVRPDWTVASSPAAKTEVEADPDIPSSISLTRR